MIKKLLTGYALSFLLLGSVLLMTPGCGHLDPAGPYKGDQFLYGVDNTLVNSYSILHTFVKWEYDNRQAMSSIPEIKKAADNIRANSQTWFATADKLRAAYVGDPSQANRTALEQAISVIRQALSEASGYLTKNSETSKPPTP